MANENKFKLKQSFSNFNGTLLDGELVTLQENKGEISRITDCFGRAWTVPSDILINVNNYNKEIIEVNNEDLRPT